MTEHEIRDVFAELHRVGVDLAQPPGLALGTGFRDGEFLTWLRALPDGLGHGEFATRLRQHVDAAQPNAGEGLPSRADGRPHRAWPTIEQLRAGIDVLVREWDPLGARLGDLASDDVAHVAQNALGFALSGLPPHHIERSIAGMLGEVEAEVWALRPSPKEQRRYLARRLIQVVVDQPGPPHENNPWDDFGAIDTTDAATSGRSSTGSTRVRGRVVRLGPRGDEPPALGPDTPCSECGRIGTVAVVMREVEPLMSRYCPTCWSGVRDKYWLQPLRAFQEPLPDRSTPEGMISALDRFREMTERAREAPRHVRSALWEDCLPYIQMALGENERETLSEREARLRQMARQLVSEAGSMYGPMPVQIDSFIRQYAASDTLPPSASDQH